MIPVDSEVNLGVWRGNGKPGGLWPKKAEETNACVPFLLDGSMWERGFLHSV